MSGVDPLLRDHLAVGEPADEEFVIAFARGACACGERPRHLRAPPATDERLVEVPWVLSRLRSGRVLEVG